MATNRCLYGCDECGRNVDPLDETAVMYSIEVERWRPRVLGPDADGSETLAMMPEKLGSHPQHVARRKMQLCERCVGSDVVRRFAPPVKPVDPAPLAPEGEGKATRVEPSP